MRELSVCQLSFLSGYEPDERSSVGRSDAPLPAADAGKPLR